MKIKYGICTDCNKKIFNFKHHEMSWCSCNKSAVDIEELYSRTIGNAEIREDEISDIIEEIREVFTWTSNYDKDIRRIEPVQRLLKGLDTDHILNILNYLTDREVIHDSTRRSINIMLNELKYRDEKSIL